ncbi:MAG TPA: CDP-glucose 4,6-dehydratase [Bdellovibrio sp.]|uniref:CDP-glucose 4,6-dehydratase n=1 Tax=Bdellovibrio sp. TaxID=28201 RepID=UPI002F1EA107
MFRDVYRGKKVMVTGHTGFKGSWLTIWLTKLGASVIGVSKDIPTKPSMFEELKLENKIKHHFCDLRNLKEFSEIFHSEKPDFIFHMAAQPIVSVSYTDPLDTITSNVIGTAHVMEVLKETSHPCTAIIITSDKAYDNVEQVWGYKEDDKLGGKDVYSGSKGAAELIIKSYFYSFLQKKNNIGLAVGRAGNVIGGGDWAKDRIVVDCMVAWSQDRAVEIRSPKATRPWQHVLEPLSGYLNLGQMTYLEREKYHGEAFNFGPRAEQNHTVQELLTDLSHLWNFSDVSKAFKVVADVPFHEAGLLKLNCDKALFYLKWQANLAYQDTIQYTGKWYYDFYKNKSAIYDLTLDQIKAYEEAALKKGLVWTA